MVDPEQKGELPAACSPPMAAPTELKTEST